MLKNKISLWIAIFININVIVGSAFFLGTADIAQKGGMLSPLTWIMWGAILLPIVLVFANLSKIYPTAGGIYVYSQKELSPFWGFFSGWGYFIGMIAGNAIIIHSFGTRIQELGFKFLGLSGLSLDAFLITIFALLNMLNINFLEKAQITFTILKVIPLFFVVFAALFLFSPSNVAAAPINLHGFFETIPLVLFAFIGFEVCSSITHQIKDGGKNASKAILISFGLVMFIYAFIQLCFLGIHGPTSVTPFLDILPKMTSNPFVINFGNAILQATIAASFLGGFYSMFYANNWIFCAIAQQSNFIGAKSFAKLNIYQMPWLTIIFQGCLTILFLIITSQNLYSLIAMCDFGVITAYLLSVLAFIGIYKKQKNNKKLILGTLAILSCLYLLYYCFYEVAVAGFILPFFVILGIGVLVNFVGTKRG